MNPRLRKHKMVARAGLSGLTARTFCRLLLCSDRTWGYTLKARGWPRLGTLTEVDDAQLRMRNSLKMGLYINVAGMLLALIGAEQIVGTLVAKVLYAQGEACGNGSAFACLAI